MPVEDTLHLSNLKGEGCYGFKVPLTSTQLSRFQEFLLRFRRHKFGDG